MASTDDLIFLFQVIGAAVVLSILVGLLSTLLVAYQCRKTATTPALRGLTPREDVFALKLSQLIKASAKFTNGKPAQIFEFLLLGSGSDALDIERLKASGINHVINCASNNIGTGPKYYGEDFKYLGFRAEDEQGYNIMQHFEDSYQFIEQARKSGGMVLIHCIMGVNRSGALATAYVMCHENIGPISAARKVLNVRKCILTNDDFQDQLIKLSSDRDLLELDKDEL